MRTSGRFSKKCVRAERLQNSQPCGSSMSDDAFVQPVVEDPVDADRVPVETGAEPISIPCEPSESEKMKHELTHIPFNPWCTSCAKGKAQYEPHKRIERTTEDSEHPQLFGMTTLFLKDTAASVGLQVLSMYVKSFGYGTSTVVDTKCITDTLAVTWGVKVLSCLGLSDIILPCDPEPSLINWAESAKSKRQERTVVRKFSKTITSQQRSNGKRSETVAGTGAHNAGSTSRPHTIQTDH